LEKTFYAFAAENTQVKENWNDKKKVKDFDMITSRTAFQPTSLMLRWE